jgi:glycosyltransferase involved in cell wall biosynthesis
MYVTHNGVGSALVRSQVLPYLRGLAGPGVDVTLLSFERGEPFPEGEFDRRRWIGVRPAKGAGLTSKIADMVNGIARILWIALTRRPELLHARSYLPTAMVWAVTRLTRQPYVFDMRGFLGEEYVEAGYWSRGDYRYRLLRLAERVLLRDAAAIVVLTQRAASRLQTDPRFAAIRGKRVVVVPCAVDLQRFTPRAEPPGPPTLVYAGSLGMWYLLDEMLLAYKAALEHVVDLRFLILNRGQHELAAAAIQRHGLSAARIEIRSATFSEMPGLLAGCHVGIAFIRPVSSKLASSPIKIAEYLACGLPTIINAGIGDVDVQIEGARAGYVIDSFGSGSLLAAGSAIARLIHDADARRAARSLAERQYDVNVGVDRYAETYARILSRDYGMICP